MINKKLSGNINLVIEKTVFYTFLILYVEEISSTFGMSSFRKATEQDLVSKEILWLSTKYKFRLTRKGLALLYGSYVASIEKFLTKEKFIPIIEHLKNGSK